MDGFLDPLESAVTSLLGISISVDVSDTSTSASGLSAATSADSTQTISGATNSLQSITSTSASQSSNSQTSSAVAKTSKTESDATSVSTLLPLTSSSISTLSSRSLIPTSTSTSAVDVSSITESESTQSTSSTSSAFISSTTLSTSTTMAPTPAVISPAANTVTNPQSETNAGNGPQAHVASIVVATVMGVFVLGTVMYLIFRYCPPVRDRWEAHQGKKNGTGAYRDAVGTNGSPSLEKQTDKARRSFMARNWYWNGTQRPGEGEDTGTGLGLGRVSMLREQALAETLEKPPPRVYTTRHSQIGRAVG